MVEVDLVGDNDDSWPISPQQSRQCIPEEECGQGSSQGVPRSVGNFQTLVGWKPGQLVSTCNPGTPGAVAGGSEIQGHPPIVQGQPGIL